jgi:hypothetical protein
MTIVGATLGAALGVAVLVLFVLFCKERRKRIRIEQERTKELSDYYNRRGDDGKIIAAHQNTAKPSMRITHQKRHELPVRSPRELPTGYEL